MPIFIACGSAYLVALGIIHFAGTEARAGETVIASGLSDRAMVEPLANQSEKDCRWDCVSLGEVMLRLDPGDDRDSHDAQLPASGKAAASTT